MFPLDRGVCYKLAVELHRFFSNLRSQECVAESQEKKASNLWTGKNLAGKVTCW